MDCEIFLITTFHTHINPHGSCNKCSSNLTVFFRVSFQLDSMHHRFTATLGNLQFSDDLQACHRVHDDIGHHKLTCHFRFDVSLLQERHHQVEHNHLLHECSSNVPLASLVLTPTSVPGIAIVTLRVHMAPFPWETQLNLFGFILCF